MDCFYRIDPILELVGELGAKFGAGRLEELVSLAKFGGLCFHVERGHHSIEIRAYDVDSDEFAGSAKGWIECDCLECSDREIIAGHWAKAIRARAERDRAAAAAAAPAREPSRIELQAAAPLRKPVEQHDVDGLALFDFVRQPALI